MTTIYKITNTLGIKGNECISQIISGVEAKDAGINTKGKEIASIADLNNDLKAGNGGFSGKVKVTEGVFEFDFDNECYQKIN